MSTSNRIIKNTMYLYTKTLLTSLVVLYTTRLILQSLGETDFGIFNIVGGVISMLGFLNTAMAVTIQRFLNFEQGKSNFEQQKVIFNVGVIFHIGIAILMAVVLLILGVFLFDGILNIPVERIPAAKVIYGCLIFSTFFTVLTVPYDACLNAHEDMLYFSIVGIIEALLKLGIAFIVVYTTSDKLILYGVLMAFVPVLSMMLMRIYCHKKYPECRFSPRKYFDRKTAKSMFSFVGWSMMGTTSNYIGNYGNMIVMNHFFGAVLNAVMGIANQIQGQLMVFSTGMLKALNPVIAKEAGSGNNERMLTFSTEGCKFSTFLLAFLAVPIFVETPFVLDFWLGDYPEWTVLFVRLQLLRALLEQLTVSMNKSLEAIGKIKTFNLFTFIFNLLPIPILYVLYAAGFEPYWHYCISISLMVICPSVAKLSLCKKYCNLNLKGFIGKMLIPVLSSITIVILIGLFLNSVMESSASRFFVSLFISEILLILFVILCMSKSERSMITNLALRKH